MAPSCPLARPLRAPLLVLIAALAAASPADALRLVNYNVLNYPGSSGAARDPNFRTVLAPLSADVIITEEQTSQNGVNEFLNSVLNTMEPGQWAAPPFIDGNDSDAALFYKPATVQFLGQWAFYPSATHLRYIHVYRLKPVGYSSAEAEFRIYAGHLKASQGFETDRLNECIGLRDSMNAMPAGTRAFLCGDMNFYTSTEPGYQKVIESQDNNTGRVYDMLPAGTWHDGAAYATIHTQSTCLTGCLYGEATGGKDDRFDFILPTYSLGTAQGLAVIPGTMVNAGADDQHFNKAITDAPEIPEGATYAAALLGTSDHLPVRVDLQLPAQIALGPGPLDFGSVIVGGPVSLNASVADPATPPAAALNYSLAASADFSAPGGGFSIAAGSPAALHAIGMNTTASGVKSGTLTVTSDAPDSPVSTLALSGTVLGHADASLDPALALTATTLDFGTQAAGGFTPLPVHVYNRGWSALQARLAVNGAVITGGDGRFSIVGGFSPVLVSGTAADFTVQFDDAGATADLTYDATLTFSSADEPLPGAAPAADLTVQLSARLESGTTAVETSAPTTLRFYAPRPNPTTADTWIGFDLPRPAPARLEIFDLAGRRVALLASGWHEAAHYDLRWNGTDESGGRVKAGLYFARFETPGLSRTTRIAKVR